MYPLPAQVQPAQQPPSSYDPVQQYHQPRQSAAIEVLSTQFGVPQYYNTGEPTSASTQIPQVYASAQYQQQAPFPQSLATNRPPESTPYAAATADYPPLTMSNLLEQAEAPHDPSANEEPYKTYLESLKQTYRYTHEGRLVEAGHRLLDLSDWLVGHASELGEFALFGSCIRPDPLDAGLTKDEPELQSQRLKLWTDFNNCWLAVLQRQKDNTQQMIDSNQRLPENQTLLQEAFLERMARELVRMCDSMEKHGLVDYEMGIWEEEIMNGNNTCIEHHVDDLLILDEVLLECLHLLEDGAEEPTGPGPRPNLPMPSRSARQG